MRKELYEKICERLRQLYLFDGEAVMIEDTPPADAERLIKHIDLWNHNVEFIEQEAVWETPAVFIEFGDIRWNVVVPAAHYTATPEVRLHIVTRWAGSVADDAGRQAEELFNVFDLPGIIHRSLTLLHGKGFLNFDLAESQTNHDHEEIVESIETYTCDAVVKFKPL